MTSRRADVNNARLGRRHRLRYRAGLGLPLVAALALLASCDASGSRPGLSAKSTVVAPTTVATPATAANSETAEPPTGSTIGSTTESTGATTVAPSATEGESDADLVVRLAVEHMTRAIDPDDLSVEGPYPITPSACQTWWVRDPKMLDGMPTPVVLLDHSALVVGFGDDNLGTVAQRCFIDEGVVPSVDVAVRLVMSLSSSIPPMALVSDAGSAESGGTAGAPSQAPTVEPIDNGFVVAFFGSSIVHRDGFHVTARLTSDGAATVVIDYL